MNPQLDDSELANSETRHGELPTLKRALDQAGLFAGSIYRMVIEKELAKIKELEADVKRLQQENDLLRKQTKEYVKDVLAEFGSITPDQDE